MQGRTARFGLVGLFVAASLFVVVSAASGGVHVSNPWVSTNTIGLSLVSTGDAGEGVGNMADGTSPIASGVDPDNFRWFNQPVTIDSVEITDTIDGDDDIDFQRGFWRLSADGVTWGTPSTFTSETAPVLTTEGIYSVVATGTDGDGGAGVATGTIIPAFGIDKTRPEVVTDLPDDYYYWRPVISGPATVTVLATDTISGVERIQYSVDGGPFDYTYDALAGDRPMVQAPAVFGSGLHNLSWHVIDNAGNIRTGDRWFIVRTAGFVPRMSFEGIGGSGAGRSRVILNGGIEPLVDNSIVHFTVQRWIKGHWKPYVTFNKSLHRYVDEFSATRTFPRHTKFRVMAADGAGHTTWKTFTTR